MIRRRSSPIETVGKSGGRRDIHESVFEPCQKEFQVRSRLTDTLDVELVLGQEKITSSLGSFGVSNKLSRVNEGRIRIRIFRNVCSVREDYLQEERCEKG